MQTLWGGGGGMGNRGPETGYEQPFEHPKASKINFCKMCSRPLFDLILVPNWPFSTFLELLGATVAAAFSPGCTHTPGGTTQLSPQHHLMGMHSSWTLLWWAPMDKMLLKAPLVPMSLSSPGPADPGGSGNEPS